MTGHTCSEQGYVLVRQILCVPRSPAIPLLGAAPPAWVRASPRAGAGMLTSAPVCNRPMPVHGEATSPCGGHNGRPRGVQECVVTTQTTQTAFTSDRVNKAPHKGPCCVVCLCCVQNGQSSPLESGLRTAVTWGSWVSRNPFLDRGCVQCVNIYV